MLTEDKHKPKTLMEDVQTIAKPVSKTDVHDFLFDIAGILAQLFLSIYLQLRNMGELTSQCSAVTKFSFRDIC
mgnify:CR=1 FL=1